MAHQTLFTGGSFITGIVERMFHLPVIFAPDTGRLLMFAAYAAATAVLCVKKRPRLVEWCLPFAGSVLVWLALGLLSALGSSPAGWEWSYFCLAMFTASVGIVGLPLIVRLGSFAVKNKATIIEAAGYEVSATVDNKAPKHSLLRSSIQPDATGDVLLHPVQHVAGAEPGLLVRASNKSE